MIRIIAILAAAIILVSYFAVCVDNSEEEEDDPVFATDVIDYDDCLMTAYSEIEQSLLARGYYVSLGCIEDDDTYGLLAVSSEANTYYDESGTTYYEAAFVTHNELDLSMELEGRVITDLYADTEDYVTVWAENITELNGQFVNKGHIVNYSVVDSVLSIQESEIPYDRYSEKSLYQPYIESNVDKTQYMFDYDNGCQIFGDSVGESNLQSVFENLDYSQLESELNLKIEQQLKQFEVEKIDIMSYCKETISSYLSATLPSSYRGVELSQLTKEFNELDSNEYLVWGDSGRTVQFALDPPEEASDAERVAALAVALAAFAIAALTYSIGGLPALIISGGLAAAAVDVAAQVTFQKVPIKDIDVGEVLITLIASTLSFALAPTLGTIGVFVSDALIGGVAAGAEYLLQGQEASGFFNAVFEGMLISTLFSLIPFDKIVKAFKTVSVDLSKMHFIHPLFKSDAKKATQDVVKLFNVKNIMKKINTIKGHPPEVIIDLDVPGHNVQKQVMNLSKSDIDKYPRLNGKLDIVVVDEVPIADFSSYAPSLNGVQAIGEIRFVNVGSRTISSDIPMTGIASKDVQLLSMSKDDLASAYHASNYDQALTDMSQSMGMTKNDLVQLKKCSGKSEAERLSVINNILEHNKVLNREELLEFTKESLALHEQFVIDGKSLKAVGVLVPEEGVHRYAHLGLNAYSKYQSSEVKIISESISSSGDRVITWEFVNISGNSDGLLKVDVFFKTDGQKMEIRHYSDGRKETIDVTNGGGFEEMLS